LQPQETAIEDVFGAITEDLLMVKNGAGELYSPEFEINTIGEWQSEHGYLVYAGVPRELMLRGDRIEPDTPITLGTGWNMIAYWPASPLDAPTALATLGEKVVLV